MRTETARTLENRIKNATGENALHKIIDQLDYYYDSDLITAKELANLDDLAMVKLAKIINA